MRPRRSTVAAFVVVASVWFAVSHTAFMVPEEAAFSYANPPTPGRANDLGRWMSKPFSNYFFPVYGYAPGDFWSGASRMSRSEYWLYSAPVYAIAALVWSTVITSGFLLVRLLRSMRAGGGRLLLLPPLPSRLVFGVATVTWFLVGMLALIAMEKTSGYARTWAILEGATDIMMFPVIPFFADPLNVAIDMTWWPRRGEPPLLTWMVVASALFACALLWASAIAVVHSYLGRLRERCVESNAS